MRFDPFSWGGRVVGAALLAAAIVATPAGAQQSSTRDLTIEQKQLADFTVPTSDLKVTAWVDKQNDTYRPGDSLQLYVKTNRDAYITVIDIGTSGKVHQIFPNQHATDNRVLAHQVLQIPGPDAPYRIRVGGPAGHELIKVIATTRPGQIIRQDQLTELGPFYSYRGNTQGLTRDLGIELKERHPPSAEGGAAMTNKVIRIVTEGASAPPPASTPNAAAVSAPVSGEELYRLGEASFYGDGGVPNYREALRLYTLAADAGHVGAMQRIGRIYEAGMAVGADLAQAMRWYRKAAEFGNTHAMVRLALIHAKSDSPRRDFKEAVRLLKQAAGQGDGIAMMNLGKMHDEGIGVEKSPREAARQILGALKAGAWTVLYQMDKLTERTRREAQAQLRQGGFYRGPVDGQIGPETRAAMVEFARAGV